MKAIANEEKASPYLKMVDMIVILVKLSETWALYLTQRSIKIRPSSESQ